ncbi:MAG: HlyD family efflux transporter periplasmic adaptor subunit [Hymenobacter sp.]|nr:HlyD family efflux transporter periplasmic adaptor subunit [Hymenobacter sp.]
MTKFLFPLPMVGLLLGLAACSSKEDRADAYGNFEAVETTVSAEATGALLRLTVEEGQALRAGQQVGQIDTVQLDLNRTQLRANQRAVRSRAPDVATQLAAYEGQLGVQQQQQRTVRREQARTRNLIAAGAAPTKQLDDLVAQAADIERQMALIRRQRAAQATTLNTERSGNRADVAPLTAQVRQLTDQIRKSAVVNPLAGTVTVKYAEPGEVVSYGTPIYQIAALDHITLRAYVGGDQLTSVRVGQPVNVYVDARQGQLRKYVGTVNWIASRSEFTPRVIQTKDERVNLVYAMKISVKNDGSLKIGMPGEVRFNTSAPVAVK